jgi:hypothetical protein
MSARSDALPARPVLSTLADRAERAWSTVRALPPAAWQIGMLGAIAVGFFLFSWWSVDTSGAGIAFGGTYSDWYNQLAEAFVHGHLNLQITPPPALVHLKNPYDPALNSSLAAPYHDLILYKDRFYVSWGPAAAVVLFIPWKLLHIGQFSDAFAIVLFSEIGLIFVLATLYWLAKRFTPTVRTWMLLVAGVALALSSVEPYLMRRPAEYEVAVSCGYCFVGIALWGLITGSYASERRPWRIAVGSAALGFALLSRFDLAVLVVLPVVFFGRAWYRSGRERSPRALLRLAVPYLLPVGVLILLLFAYNYERFGSPTQVGAAFQLAGVDQQSNFNYQLSSIAPGLFYFLIAPIQTTLAFPYFALGPPPYYPWQVPSYMQTELTSGVFTTTPILASLLFLPYLAFAKRWSRDLLALLGLLAACGFVVALVIAWGIPGTTMRYEADFATLFLLPAIIAWFMLSASPTPRLLRWGWKGLGTLGLLLGAGIGAAISITGPYDELRQFDTAKYIQLGNVTDFIPTFVTMFIGHPEVVKDTYQCGNGECGIAAPSHSSWTLDDHNGVELDVVAPFGGWRVGIVIADANPKLHGSAVTVQVGNTLSTFTTGVGPRRIFLPLHQGLNRLTYDVPGADPVTFTSITTSRAPK